MILKEIEMDLPYVPACSHDLLSNDDQKKDYQLNWMWKRRKFQLMTRCMTSMIERIMPRIDTKDCRKILIECEQQPSNSKIRNALGIYCVQVPFEVDRFWGMSNLERRVYTIEKIREALMIIFHNDCFDVTALVNACDEVARNDYVNEWYWRKPVKSKHLSVQVKVKHDVENVSLYLVFRDLLKETYKEVFLVSDLPDERAYGKYLGKLEWVSDRTAKLSTKNDECFVVSY